MTSTNLSDLLDSNPNASRPKTQGTAITASQLTKAFKGSGTVVNTVDLSISSGEFVSFLGPSGCGKSTLLRLIAGLDQPTSGTLTTHSAERLEFFKGFVFQEPHLVPWRNVLSNVALPLELMGRAKKEASAEAEAALAGVGLSDALLKFPNQLSGGMKMRVSLARALIGKPSLLLLDEPFAALDEITRHSLQEELRKIWEKGGLTVLFVTHSVREAVFLSDRICVFSKRPARLIEDFRVQLPRNRNHEVRVSDEFSHEMKRLYQSVPVEEAHL